jgi:hypothetical protein
MRPPGNMSTTIVRIGARARRLFESQRANAVGKYLSNAEGPPRCRSPFAPASARRKVAALALLKCDLGGALTSTLLGLTTPLVSRKVLSQLPSGSVALAAMWQAKALVRQHPS